MVLSEEKELRKVWCHAVSIQEAIEMGDLSAARDMAEEIEVIVMKVLNE